MPDTRVRLHLPVTTRVRGRPAHDQLDVTTAAAARAVRRAVTQARARAEQAGRLLVAGPHTRVVVRIPPTESAYTPMLSLVDNAVRAGVRLGTGQALFDFGVQPALPDLAHTPAGVPLPDAEDPPRLAVFATVDDLQTAALEAFPEPGALLPNGVVRTGVYGVAKGSMTPALFWVAGAVTAGIDRGKPLWQSITVVMGDVKGDQWVARGAGNEPAALLPGHRYRLDARVPARPRKKTKRRPAPRAYLEEEGGGRRRPLHLSDGAYEMVRGRVIRFAVAFGAEAETEEPPPKPPLAEDVRRRRGDVWRLLHGDTALSAESQGEPEWLWEWFGYLNIQPASVRANPNVRAAIMHLIKHHGESSIIDMELSPVHSNNLWSWRRRFLKAFCLSLAISMLAESRSRMEQFRATVAAPDWQIRFATFLKSLSGTAATVNEYRRLERLLRLADKYAEAIKNDPDSNATDEEIERAVAALYGSREEIRKALAGMQAPTAAEETLTLAGELQPLLIMLTIHQHDILFLDPRTQAEQIAEAVDDFAQLGPEGLSHVVDDDLQRLIGKTIEANNRLIAKPDDAYQLGVVQHEARCQLLPWFQTVPPVTRDWDQLVDHDWVSWLGLGLGLLVLAFVFPPLAGAIAVAGFGIGTYTAYTSISKAMRLRALSRARLAQFGFQQLVSDEEVNTAIVAAVVDTFFTVLDIGPSARAVTRGTTAVVRGTGIVARRAASALGLRLEEAVFRAGDLAAWPQLLNNRTFTQLSSAIERHRALLTRAGTEVTDAELLAGELFDSARQQMVARYEQHLVGVRARFGEALEAGQLTADDIRALQDWLAKQRLRPDDFLHQLTEDPHFFDELVARQVRGEAAGTAARQVSFLPVDIELAAVTEELGVLAELLGPERMFAFREAAGLGGLTYLRLANRLATILRRVDAPEEVLAALERLLAGRSDAAHILESLGELADPRAALRSLTPELLTQVESADLVRALGESPGAGEVVERIAVAVEGEVAGQLVRGVRHADGSQYVQRWNHATASWETAPRRALPEGEPAPAPGEPAPRPPEERLELEFEEFALEEPPPLDQPLAAPPIPVGQAAKPARAFRQVLDSVQITPQEIAAYRQRYNQYVRQRGASRRLRTLDDYARWRHGLATRQFSRGDIRSAVERSWEQFNAAIQRVQSIPPADLARLQAQYRANLSGPWRDEPFRMLSEDEWVRWRYGVESGRISPVEGPPVPLGERIGQLAGHELERVVNGRLPAGSANSRDFKIFGVDEGFRPDHLPPGSQTRYIDPAGRIHATPGRNRIPISARYVGDSKYLEGVVAFDAQTEAFVRLAAATDEKAVVFYVRWRNTFPPSEGLTAGPFGIGYELPAAARSGVVSSNLLDFAKGRGIGVRIVSDPNWK
ncbi:hypothetical protein [Kribbella sp. NBC_00359]|uniref:hypothetical protein n=1 Tax=Kribbella sp. NBC_00359 TaxID=2975966 RepID=UPI002E2039A5